MSKWPTAMVIHLHFHLYSVLQFKSFHSVFHSFHGLINSTSSPALSVWVLIAQQVEYCSANAEATGSNPVEAPNNLFSGQIRNYLNSDSTAIVTYSFAKNEINYKKPPIISIHFIQHQKTALLSNFQLNGHNLGFSPRTKKSEPNRATLHTLNKITEKCRQ